MQAAPVLSAMETNTKAPVCHFVLYALYFFKSFVLFTTKIVLSLKGLYARFKCSVGILERGLYA